MKPVGQQRGYALLLVLGAMALVTLIGARLAQRIEGMVTQTAQWQAQARGSIEAASALAFALYWVTTQPPSPNGFGDGGARHWTADGQWFKLATGGVARLQDHRGLLSVNVIDREPFARLLVSAGVDPGAVASLIDTLEDYTDLDSLRRLNGAERPQYQGTGLPGLRNDWMLSTRELCQIPAWREHAGLCERLAPWLSTRRSADFNPNTAPEAVLRAQLPDAAPGQIERLLSLRSPRGLNSATEAEAVSGLKFRRMEAVFWVGNTLQIAVWAEGQPRAAEYNVLLTPESIRAPWLITEVHRLARPDTASLSRQTLGFAPPASPASAAPLAQIQPVPAIRSSRSSP